MTTLLLALLGAVQDPDLVKVSLDATDLTLENAIHALALQAKIPVEIEEAVRKRIDLKEERVTCKIDQLTLVGALKVLLLVNGVEIRVIDKKKVRIVEPKPK